MRSHKPTDYLAAQLEGTLFISFYFFGARQEEFESAIFFSEKNHRAMWRDVNLLSDGAVCRSRLDVR